MGRRSFSAFFPGTLIRHTAITSSINGPMKNTVYGTVINSTTLASGNHHSDNWGCFNSLYEFAAKHYHVLGLPCPSRDSVLSECEIQKQGSWYPCSYMIAAPLPIAKKSELKPEMPKQAEPAFDSLSNLSYSTIYKESDESDSDSEKYSFSLHILYNNTIFPDVLTVKPESDRYRVQYKRSTHVTPFESCMSYDDVSNYIWNVLTITKISNLVKGVHLKCSFYPSTIVYKSKRYDQDLEILFESMQNGL